MLYFPSTCCLISTILKVLLIKQIVVWASFVTTFTDYTIKKTEMKINGVFISSIVLGSNISDRELGILRVNINK